MSSMICYLSVMTLALRVTGSYVHSDSNATTGRLRGEFRPSDILCGLHQQPLADFHPIDLELIPLLDLLYGRTELVGDDDQGVRPA